jgi:hypothetical protein
MHREFALSFFFSQKKIFFFGAFYFSQKLCHFSREKKSSKMTTPENTAQESKNVAFDELVKIAQASMGKIFQEPTKTEEPSKGPSSGTQESKNGSFEEMLKILKESTGIEEKVFRELPKNAEPCSKTKSCEDHQPLKLDEALGSLKTLVENVLLEMDKLDQEELQNNQRTYPRFTKLYDSWKMESKPKPHWDQVNTLEVYLYSAENQDKSEVSRFFLSQTWKDIKDESYVGKVCAIVQKIFPHNFVGVQHSFSLFVVKHLQLALKPNLDNC